MNTAEKSPANPARLQNSFPRLLSEDLEVDAAWVAVADSAVAVLVAGLPVVAELQVDGRVNNKKRQL